MISPEDLRDRLERIPRKRLIQTPTPLEEITLDLGGSAGRGLLIKRDDLTGLAFGGNKGRKLEFIIADAVAAGSDSVVTWGGLQSNWCLQTAAAAARAGLHAVLVLLRKPGAAVGPQGNVLLDHLCGADVRIFDVGTGQAMLRLDDVADIVLTVVEEEQAAGRSPYLAPIGGSLVEGSMTRPLGAMGYALALVELLEQARSRELHIDSIVHAGGSAGTQAGLLAAARAVAPETRVIGISVTTDRATMQNHVRTIADQLLEALSLNLVVEDDQVIVRDDFLSPGYAVLTPEISRRIAALAASHGVMLDPVYTGKAWMGLLELLETGFVSRDEHVVFIHTGGTAALFPYGDQLTGHLSG